MDNRSISTPRFEKGVDLSGSWSCVAPCPGEAEGRGISDRIAVELAEMPWVAESE
jgi:hypothetical protein